MANFWEKDEVVGGGQSQAQIKFWENDAVAEEAPKQPEAWNPALGLSRDLVNGIPVLGPIYTGAVDQVTSNIAGMITGEDPQAIRDRVNAKQEAYEAENPVLSTVGQIAGGTAAMVPLGMTGAGAKALGIGQNQGLMSRMLWGGGSGGTIAGADSLARGNDPYDAVISAIGGAGLGAAGGAVAPAIGRAVGSGVDRVKRALGFQGDPAMVPVSRPAADILTRAADADGTLGSQAGINMSQAGPNAMLVDASPSFSSLMDTAIQRSGGASRQALDAVERRASQANIDITRALDEGLGQPRGIYTTQNAIRTGSAPARHAAYEAAYAAPIDYSSDAGRTIEGLMQRVPQSAINAANNLMRTEGVKSPQIMAKIADDGTVTFLRMPSVEQLDYITRGLNTVAKGSEGSGALGGMTDVGRAYGNLARDIRSAVKEAAPAYANALETAATPIGEREALLFGADLLKPSMARDEAADIISGLSGPERQYAMQAVRSQIDEALANVRAVASDPNIDAREARKAIQDLSSRAAREKITLLMGDDAASARMMEQLDQAAASLNLRAGVAANSRTFGRTAMDQVVDALMDTPGSALRQGQPLTAGQRVIQNALGGTAQDRIAAKDKVYKEIVDVLTMNPDQGMDLIAGLGIRNATKGNPRFGSSLVPGVTSTGGQAVLDALLGYVPPQ